jgi:hypothetical protein
LFFPCSSYHFSSHFASLTFPSYSHSFTSHRLLILFFILLTPIPSYFPILFWLSFLNSFLFSPFSFRLLHVYRVQSFFYLRDSRLVRLNNVYYFIIVSYPIGTGGSFPGGKAVGGWNRPLNSN